MSAGLTVDCAPKPAVSVHIDAAPRPAVDVNVNIGGGGGGLTKETDPTVPAWAKNPVKPTYTAKEVGALPDTTAIPTKESELANDAGYMTGYEENDPTVPSWAKAATKPSYSKSEIGLGNVDNVRQYSSDNPPPYPVTKVNGQTGDVKLDAEDVGARASTWMPTHSDVGADKSGTAASAVSVHNTKTDAHNDIRLLITTLTTRLDALANSDDDTLDQMAEVVAYIKSNRNLIEQITTGKVSVSDIVNNLTTNVVNKPLSAAQGVALKALIDAITIPTKLSQLTNDKGYITGYTETDPTVPAWAKSPNKPSYTADEVGALSADELTEAINEALADAKTSGEFDGQPGKDGTSVTVKSVSESAADGGSNVVTFSDGKTLTVKNGSKGDKGDAGYTPQKSVDYWTSADKNEILNQLAAQTASLRDAAFAPVPQLPADGRVKGDDMGGGGESTPNFKNLLDGLVVGDTLMLNARVSSSNTTATDKTTKAANGNITIPGGIPVNVGDVFRINLPESVFSTNYTRIIMYQANGARLNVNDALPANDTMIPLSYADGVAVITVPNTVNGGVPVLMKINLAISTTAATEADIADLIITKNQEITYTEASGGVAEVSADFDVKTVKSTDIYGYVDALAAKYPGYIARENLGKDQSGIYDINRYILNGQRYYLAWQRQNYPKMFAWVNGSTTIYSVSVSPRVGDTMYSTKYIGTSYGTVSSVNYTAQGVTPKAASTRTVGGKVFVRKPESDVEPTLLYTINQPEYGVAPASVGARLRSHGGAVQKKITAVGNNSVTGDSTTVYTRYPLGDCTYDWQRPMTVTIWANEHQDTPEPAIIMARFIRDLCENTYNALLHYLKTNVQLVIIPVLNPHGYNWQDTGTQYGDGYYNVNNVNINRNYDTPGWSEGPYDTGTGALGSYPGSEVETQYAMNTLQLSNAAVGMSIHTVGYLDATGTIDNPASNGLCHYQGNGFNAAKIAQIAQVMWGNYNLLFTDYGTTDPDTTGKSPAYITYARCVGGLVEMQPRDGLNPQGTDGDPVVMEACYTEFLQCLHMWLTDAQEG